MNNGNLMKLSEKIDETFPKDWFNEFLPEQTDNTEDAKGNTEKQINLNDYILNFNEVTFEHLNFSIIEGKYISFPDDTLDLISEISIRISEIPIPTVPFIEQSIAELIGLIKDALNEYKIHIKKVSRNLSHSTSIILFEGFDELSSIVKPSDNYSLPGSKDLYDLFRINLFTLKCDHFLSLNPEQTLIPLIFSSRKIAKGDTIHSTKDYAQIILNKIRFLIRKIIYRYEEKEIPYNYIFDLEEKELDKETFPVDIFQDWDKRCRIHYEKESNYIASIKAKINGLNHSRKDFSFTLYHTKTKYHKDIVKQIKGLEQTAQDFKTNIANTFPDSSSSFDQFAVNTTLNYLENNVLSLKIEQNESYDEIYNTIKRIEELQGKTNIKNYFPYLKYLGYLSQVIDNIRTQQNTIQRIDELEKKTIEYEKYFTKLEDAYLWCRKHFYLSYQLPYDECITKETINGKEYDIFLASSFILPIDYDEVKEKVNAYRNKLDRYKSLLNTNKFIINDLKEIEQVKQDVKGTERRTIEILGIFTAIVIFASSFINVSQKIIGSSEHFTSSTAFLFMFALGSSLALFVAVIIIIARERSHFSKNWPVFTTLLVIGVVTWYLLIFNPFNVEMTKDKNKDSNPSISTPSDTTNHFLNKTDTVGVE